MNNQLTLQLVKARHRAYQDAVGELAPQTFIGNDMRHKSFLFQVDRAYERKLHQRCGFANAFCGNKFLETLKRGNGRCGEAKRVLAITGNAASSELEARSEEFEDRS